MFFAGVSNQRVESTCRHVFFELLVPERVEVLAQLFRELPRFISRQLVNRIADLGDGAHEKECR